MVTERPLIYLAGPDVFFPNAEDMAQIKLAICAEHGLQGLWPADNAKHRPQGINDKAYGHLIASRNEEYMNQAAAIVANLTPYHGPSGDIGTAYEMGYMRAQGKLVVGYTNDALCFAARVAEWNGGGRSLHRDERGLLRTHDGFMIEDFGPEFRENVMLEHAGALLGGNLHPNDPNYLTDLTLFTKAVSGVANVLRVQSSARMGASARPVSRAPGE